MKKMTRNEAAKYLGVNPQTITNWVERGLLTGYCDKKSRRFYVNADDVESHAREYKMLHVSENVLDGKLKELAKVESDVDTKLNILRKQFLLTQSVNNGKVRTSLSKLYCTIQGTSTRQASIVMDFLDGWKLQDIADKYHLTRERIRQTIVHGMDIFCSLVDNMINECKENVRMRAEIEDLKKRLTFEMGKERSKVSLQIPGILSSRLIDYGLSVRTLNVMKAYDIETVGELVSHSRDEVERFRNLGRKSVYQLEEFVRQLGLDWGMEIAKIYEKGAQRMRDSDWLDSIFQSLLLKVAANIKERYSVGEAEATSRAFEEMELYVDRVKKINEQHNE